MTPPEFITALFGEGWTQAQLPVFLEMLRRCQEDAARYHELRDEFTDQWLPSREEMNKVDDHVDARRQSSIV
jgi:hypothetical protein